MSARSPIRWLALGVVLASACPGCGGGTGSSSGSEPSTFSGTVVVVEGGGAFKVDVDADFRSDGTVKAELTWAVVAAGSGRFGSQAPRLTLAIFRECIGWDCPPEGASAGPSPQGPLAATASVNTASHYVIRIGHEGSCGGCRIEYTLRVMHPRGSLKPRPLATCPLYVVSLGRCGNNCPGVTDPEVDLKASPPQARMRVGEVALVDVQFVGCGGSDFLVEGWSLTNPSVAAILERPTNTTLSALARGQTRVLADVVQIDGSRLQAELAVCSGSPPVCTPLLLDVVR